MNTTTTARAQESCANKPCCTMDQSIAKISPDFWIAAALGSIGLSLILKLNGKRDDSRFVGDWAAPFLLLGVYTKLVKLEQRSPVLEGSRTQIL